MAFKKAAIFAAIGASVLTTACGVQRSAVMAGGIPPQDTGFVEVLLTDGTFLTCSQMVVRAPRDFLDGYSVLDCDWDHPNAQHDSNLEMIGVYQVMQKKFQNGKTYNCLSFDVHNAAIENCDWNHPLQS